MKSIKISKQKLINIQGQNIYLYKGFSAKVF